MQNEKLGSKKVRKGDRVVVIAGNCKGQHGVVSGCCEDSVLIDGINLRKKHVKKSKENPQGGVITFESPVHVSNVCPCDEEGNALKVKVLVNEQGERELYYMRDGQQIIWRSVKRSKN
jgi:large subunit ribosomal protein L24